MCLDYVMKPTRKKNAVRNLKIRTDGYVWMWRLFNVDRDGNLIAQFSDFPFFEGKNTAKGRVVRRLRDGKHTRGDPAYQQYTPGFHVFKTKKEAKSWSNATNYWCGCDHFIASVQIRKKWITAVGGKDTRTVFVCKHIII